VTRLEQSNIFQLRLPAKMPNNFDFAIPWQTSDTMTARILGEEIDKVIITCSSCTDTIPKKANIISGIPVDTVYSYYMKYSDNFIAEQLLLMSSALKFGRMDARQIIEAMLGDQLADIRSELQWYDGSGLSRYNLFTPHSMANILNKIYESIGWTGVKSIFAAGGQSGTIHSWYAGDSGPYVYAKTGTLRNKHCLSGFLKTDKGRILIFSFMHNHYIGSSSPVKESMQEVLAYLKAHY
jgi:D-alanyl-D-alanine carboxypeptidase/D-alanyl-D-alanine-endopeptidase (penicillin-binding protein 4)